MKKIVCFILLVISFLDVYAQQDPQFSMNMFNILAVNPAKAGGQKSINATFLKRQQWVGIENAPLTTLFNIDAPIKLGRYTHGLGLSVMSDKLGFEKNNSIHLSYSFHHKMGRGMLSYGISLGIQNNTLNGQWYVPQGDQFTSPGGDPLLGSQAIDESLKVFDSGFGLFYYQNRFYLGVSATHLNKPILSYGNDTKIYLGRHYYLLGGYSYTLSDSFEILPSFHFKTDGKTSQIDINSNLLYNNKIWGGVSYRLDDAVVALAGVKLENNLRIGYAYDISISRMAKASHELLLSYDFIAKFNKRKKTYKSIRFL